MKSFKINSTLGQLFSVGDNVEVDGVPFVVRKVDSYHGLYLSADIPGPGGDDRSARITEWLPWYRILTVDEV